MQDFESYYVHGVHVGDFYQSDINGIMYARKAQTMDRHGFPERHPWEPVGHSRKDAEMWLDMFVER